MVYLNATTSVSNAMKTLSDLTVVNGVSLLYISILGCVFLIVLSRSRDKGMRASINAACIVTTITSILLGITGMVTVASAGSVVMFMIVVTLLSFIPLTSR